MTRRQIAFRLVLVLCAAGMFLVVGQASANPTILLGRDDEASRLLTSLAVRGVVPIEAIGFRQHARRELVDWLERALAVPLSESDEARAHDLLSYLRFQTSSMTVRSNDPLGIAAVSIGIETRAERDDSGVSSIASIRSGIMGETGNFGFLSELTWGVSSEGYPYRPDEHPLAGESFSFLPNQINGARGHVSVGTPRLNVQVGRLNAVWGPGAFEHLALSAASDGKDGVRFAASFGPLRFESLTFALPHAGTSTYWSGHRLSARVSDRVALSAYEGVVYRDRLELAYVNPVGVYVFLVPMVESGIAAPGGDGYAGDNMFFGGDIVARIAPRTVAFVDIFFDDLQPQEGVGLLRNWDSKYGVHAGIHAFDVLPLGGADVRAEYAFANQWLYTHEADGLNYSLGGRPLGLSTGPDSDLIAVEVSRAVGARGRTGLLHQTARQGETRLADRHTAADPLSWNYLSGTVESTSESSAFYSHTRAGGFEGVVRAGIRRVRNLAHRAGVDETHLTAEVAVRVTY